MNCPKPDEQWLGSKTPLRPGFLFSPAISSVVAHSPTPSRQRIADRSKGWNKKLKPHGIGDVQQIAATVVPLRSSQQARPVLFQCTLQKQFFLEPDGHRRHKRPEAIWCVAEVCLEQTLEFDQWFVIKDDVPDIAKCVPTPQTPQFDTCQLVNDCNTFVQFSIAGMQLCASPSAQHLFLIKSRIV